MKIGIPRAFLYHRHHHLWETFLKELGVEYLVSPETNKSMITKGMSYAIDEACLSSKIYLGHVAWLIGKCDAILVPRVANVGSDGIVCTKFMALPDIVSATFRESGIKVLTYDVDDKEADGEMGAFLKLGKTLGANKAKAMMAYLLGKQAERAAFQLESRAQEMLLARSDIKILVVAHGYNIYDKYVGQPILESLRAMGATPILADLAPKKEAIEKSAALSVYLPWAYNKELVGAVALYRDQVDGIILMSTFPCGPDSLVNEVLLRRIKEKPLLNLTMDGQEGSAGLETRLESFIDIIQFRREEAGHGKH